MLASVFGAIHKFVVYYSIIFGQRVKNQNAITNVWMCLACVRIAELVAHTQICERMCFLCISQNEQVSAEMPYITKFYYNYVASVARFVDECFKCV